MPEDYLDYAFPAYSSLSISSYNISHQISSVLLLPKIKRICKVSLLFTLQVNTFLSFMGFKSHRQYFNHFGDFLPLTGG